MIFYAEWWKRDYKGDMASKENAAAVIGFTSKESTKKLFEVAKLRLMDKRYPILHKSENGKNLYFRTLLFQGGLQLNYIKANLDNPQSPTVAFFKALVKALAEDEAFRNDAEQDNYEVVNERVNERVKRIGEG